MDGSTGSERVFVARVSAVLFVLGLLVPFFMVFVGGALKIHDGGAGVAFGFFSVSEVLAVILGGVGWRHASGKTGSVGGVAAICLALAFGTLRCNARYCAVVAAGSGLSEDVTFSAACGISRCPAVGGCLRHSLH